MSDDKRLGTKSGIHLVKEAQQLKEPPLYQVLLLNDDFTPMEFVVEVLVNFFAMGRAQAHEVMMRIHEKGQAVCGIYPRDIAETKVEQVMAYARQFDHPLRCVFESVD